MSTQKSFYHTINAERRSEGEFERPYHMNRLTGGGKPSKAVGDNLKFMRHEDEVEWVARRLADNPSFNYVYTITNTATKEVTRHTRIIMAAVEVAGSVEEAAPEPTPEPEAVEPVAEAPAEPVGEPVAES